MNLKTLSKLVSLSLYILRTLVELLELAFLEEYCFLVLIIDLSPLYFSKWIQFIWFIWCLLYILYTIRVSVATNYYLPPNFFLLLSSLIVSFLLSFFWSFSPFLPHLSFVLLLTESFLLSDRGICSQWFPVAPVEPWASLLHRHNLLEVHDLLFENCVCTGI